MFVTNLKDFPVTLDGMVVLRPNQENRYLDDTPELKDRAARLADKGFIKVFNSDGLTKLGEVDKTAFVKTAETENQVEQQAEQPTEAKPDKTAKAKAETKADKTSEVK